MPLKIKANAQDIAAALEVAVPVTSSRNTIPILTTVLIEADDDGDIRIIATDQEIGVRCRIAGSVEKPGQVCLNAKVLSRLIREIGDASITLTADDNHRCRIQTSDGGKYNLAGANPKEFPALPVAVNTAAHEMDSETLLQALALTKFAIATDETRTNLMGLFFQRGDGAVTFTATDGHRLAQVAVDGAGTPIAGCILPLKGLTALVSALAGFNSKVSIGLDGSEGMTAGIASATVGDITISMRLIEGEFPDYKQVIPKERKIAAEISREKLTTGLRRVSTVASERTRGVKLEVGKKLAISSINPDVGDGEESVPVLRGDGTIEIGVNAKYLLDALTALDCETVELGLVDEVSPMVIRPIEPEAAVEKRFTYVVMPMRL